MRTIITASLIFSIKPVPAMQGLANSDKVVYLSTFSRVLAPSIRIAYMVLPKKMLEKFDKHFGTYSSTVPRFEQHTLNKFISRRVLFKTFE